jgi:hypothetical protein
VEVRFTTSGAVVDAVMPDRRAALLAALPAPSGGAQRTSAPAASSTLAPALPPTTIALLESHDVASLLDALSAQAGAGTTDPLASLAPSLGGLNAASLGTALGGGVGQVGAVVVSSGDTLSAGLVAQVADASAVATTLDQLRLLGGLLGGVTSTDYKGTRILSIPVATLIRLSEGLGGTPRPGATAAPTLTPAPAPSAATNPLAGIAAGQVLSLAVRGNLLVIGLGDGLARAVVDTAAGASLADQAGYRSALTAAGTPNLGSLYLDLAALRSAGAKVGPVASAAPRASANPFMEAAGVVAGSLTSTDGLLRGRLVITVR